jgi:hypothetical protein
VVTDADVDDQRERMAMWIDPVERENAREIDAASGLIEKQPDGIGTSARSRSKRRFSVERIRERAVRERDVTSRSRANEANAIDERFSTAAERAQVSVTNLWSASAPCLGS